MTPPTYSPWLNLFEAFARFGLRRAKPALGDLQIGSPDSQKDVAGSDSWREFHSSRALYAAWGPRPESDWSPYHRPTLFAALDALGKPAFPQPPSSELTQRPPPMPFVRPDQAIILDLPSEASVAYAAALAAFHGHQPVVTFNNWPHQRALVDLRLALAALLFYVPWVQHRPPEGPPVFLLDCRRFGFRPGGVNEFDNRYYLLESDLPSPRQLAAHGIRSVLYARPPRGTVYNPPWVHAVDPRKELNWLMGAGGPAPGAQLTPDGRPHKITEEEDDMNAWLIEAAKVLRLEIVRLQTTWWAWEEPEPFAPAPRKTVLNTVKDPAFNGFRRNAAGGFGVLVPEETSGVG